jgi:hypothetical protein
VNSGKVSGCFLELRSWKFASVVFSTLVWLIGEYFVAESLFGVRALCLEPDC